MDFAKYLHELIEAKGFNRAEFAKLIEKSESYVYFLCSGKKKAPKPEMMEKIANALRANDLEKKTLMSFAVERALGSEYHMKLRENAVDYFVPTEGFKAIPLLGVCPASAKTWTNDEIVEWHELPESIVGDKRMYLLKVKGDSMSRAGIDDGDYVLIDAERIPDNGQIAVFCVDHEYTIKRFHAREGKITLSPDSNNPYHVPMFFDDSHEVVIRGVVHAIYLKKVK